MAKLADGEFCVPLRGVRGDRTNIPSCDEAVGMSVLLRNWDRGLDIHGDLHWTMGVRCRQRKWWW